MIKYIGHIYVIKSPQTDKVYIGSTYKNPCERFAKHKVNYGQYLKGKYPYTTAFEILQCGDAYVELLEVVEGKRKKLKSRERFHIENSNSVNKNIPGQTPQESCKRYYEKNKEKINQKFICAECGGRYTQHHKKLHEQTNKHLISHKTVNANQVENQEEEKEQESWEINIKIIIEYK